MHDLPTGTPPEPKPAPDITPARVRQMMLHLESARKTWAKLPRAERHALRVGVGSPATIDRLTIAELWGDDGITGWGKFVRDTNLREFDPAQWAVDGAGQLRHVLAGAVSA
ncbi:MAG TPA: hypothetical protein VGK17_03105 [Propionicimonas sp.]|jgi:hypothetical protein